MAKDMSELTDIVPEKLGKFEIVRELGRGSMAVVYLGYDPFMDRNVAVKVALPKFLKDPETGPSSRRCSSTRPVSPGCWTTSSSFRSMTRG